MNYPVWEVPLLGGGLVIALIAIPHVFVSHFAIGGGIFLAFSEWRGRRDNRPELIELARRNSLFFVLVTLVFGAVTGVGIWFSIGLVHPPATSALIRNFVFAWAIEWVFFLVEIAAALLYYYSWDRVDWKTHQIIGWAYGIAAWMSLFVINGILAFMLTPGAWIENGSFWSAFFNPTYFPSLFIRTCVCLALAGLYALFMASREAPGAVHDSLVQYASKWLIPAFIGLPIFGAWFAARLPPLARAIVQGGAPTVTMFAVMSVVISGMIFVFAYFIAYRNPQSVNPAVALIFLVLGLGVTGVTEWVREAVRKPYVIYDYMYSNAVRKSEVAQLRETGVLAVAKWATVREIAPGNRLEAGREVFTLQCAYCHTIDGYNGIRLFVRGWSERFIGNQIRHLDELKRFMPPFAGNVAEREALAAWLASLNPGVPTPADDRATVAEVAERDLVAVGQEVYDFECANCHTLDGENPLRPKVRGWSQSYIAEQITRLEHLKGDMPPFEGTDAERRALAAYLATLNADAQAAGGAQ